MSSDFENLLQKHRNAVYILFRKYIELNKPFLLSSELRETFQEFCQTNGGKPLAGTEIETLIMNTQEAAVREPWLYFAVRFGVANWKFQRFQVQDIFYEDIPVTKFLRFKEYLLNPNQTDEDWIIGFDIEPFGRGFPHLKDKKFIGRGVEFLNRYLSNRLFVDRMKGDKLILDFLRVHEHDGQPLMLNYRIENVDELQKSLHRAEEFLQKQSKDTRWQQVREKMQELGFEAGWGRTVARMLDTLNLLSDILEAPEPKNLEQFLGRIPMIFNLVILSPHGYFGQSNVLGLPDTGGQIVYILDQVRALENEMRMRIYEQGLDIEPKIVVITRLIPEAEDTPCNQPQESILGTRSAKILRIPFRTKNGDIVPYWISRFKIWPYLERFAFEAEKAVLAELGTRPDLIIGNYSDGNLVASMLSQRLGVTQCNIAHALEKNKYLYSELYWKDYEEQYHFSTQFTADLISMNAADFIITSTYQEIAGNRETVGQYESYTSFTMPELYRVVKGINVFDPKFNIVSPGADDNVYFPYNASDRRLKDLHGNIENLLFNGQVDTVTGNFAENDKPIIFSMSRLDRIKNISGLVEWYGSNPKLQSLANLFIIAGFIDESWSQDEEEKQQIRLVHELIAKYDLHGKIRWSNKQSDKNFNGELYRYIADKRGIFVQPALFEAFGLTVIEAMTSGLPTFATRYGGPLEIIEDGVSGFHIDPNHGEEAAQKMADFFERCQKQPDYWQTISKGAIKRVEARYTWKLYASRLMTLSRVYGFWKYVTNLERGETLRYLEMFYGLMLKQRVREIPT